MVPERIADNHIADNHVHVFRSMCNPNKQFRAEMVKIGLIAQIANTRMSIGISILFSFRLTESQRLQSSLIKARTAGR